LSEYYISGKIDFGLRRGAARIVLGNGTAAGLLLGVMKPPFPPLSPMLMPAMMPRAFGTPFSDILCSFAGLILLSIKSSTVLLCAR
jgi:hypothetical protein